MKNKPFVHLHLHTCFSLLDGGCHIDQIMDTALQNNMPGVAITDHGVMYGLIDFYKAAQKKGIKPILGCEAYITMGSRFDRKTDTRKPEIMHLVLLAKNNTGYHNLIKLISSAHLEGFYYKPRIDKEILAAHHEGLIGLSACLKGEIAIHLTNDNMKDAQRAAGEYADIFGKDNFFLEVQDHGIPEQRKVNKLIKDLAGNIGLPLVATNDVHYIKKEHAVAHEILLCIQTQTVMTDPKRMRYSTEEFYMKTRDEMESLFRDMPESIDNTLAIYERCNVELDFGQPHFPVFRVPADTTQKDYLIEKCIKGISSLYNIKDPQNPKDDRECDVIKRFNMELEVIEKTGFINYFLVVWDFVRFAKDNGIPVGPGRGSGGGSLTAYVLGITSIDPLHYDLIFERFLNPQRVSPPDFDIDFCQARREEVIEYVKNKYHRENVAQIITFGSLGAKTVIRDIGRVLEIPYSDCDRYSKMVPDDPKIKLKHALEVSRDLKKAYQDDSNCKKILDYGFVLEGLYRNPGTHAAGVVIGEKPLTEIIPLSLDKNKQIITQYTMEPLGDIGLLKMDFLGLKTLTVIQGTINMVKETKGIKIDLNSIPMNDKLTYELLNRGDTVGVFQLESTGMRDLIRRIGIDRIEDLIAMIALYRPGPMNMLDDYVKRKTGKVNVKYDHELMEPILAETYGIMLYQEQVQKVANILAGYSLGEADILRRAMGKKKQEEMDKQRSKFISGSAKTSHINTKKAGKIFDNMAKFAGYGFNKAHSTGYAIIAYQTAYLKANYTAEFMSALLSNEIGNFDKIPIFINEAREMDLKIIPPDVNSSWAHFRPDGNTIHFGLAGIKNIGYGTAEAIVEERKKNGQYLGLVEFCSRIDSQHANKKVMESLALSGAFDSLNIHRARIFNGVDFAMARAFNVLRDRRSGQGTLFDILENNKEKDIMEVLPDCEPWHESEVLAGERELLGIYMSGHPLTRYEGLLKKYQMTDIEGLSNIKDKTVTRIGGIIAGINKTVTKIKKESMAILQMEDIDGCIDVLVFPEAYQKYGVHIKEDNAILVCGEVSKKEDQPKIIAFEIYPIEDTPEIFTNNISVHIPSAHIKNGKLEEIKDVLRTHPGKVPVMICLLFPSGEKVILDTDSTVNVLPDETLIHKLEHILGEKSVYVSVKTTPCINAYSNRKWRK